MLRAKALVAAGVDALVLDIAHGHSEHAHRCRARASTREFGADTDVIAGNVATRAGAEDLIEAGADAIKVGVGPGGVCTTRLVAGVGVPQLTAINECAGMDVPVDRRRRHPPLGRHRQGAGRRRVDGDDRLAVRRHARSRRASSRCPSGAWSSRSGACRATRRCGPAPPAPARQLDDEYFEQRAAEGVTALVPYKGEVGKLIAQLMGGVKSAMSYCNARTIPELWEKAEFIRVTQAGLVREPPPRHAREPRLTRPSRQRRRRRAWRGCRDPSGTGRPAP